MIRFENGTMRITSYYTVGDNEQWRIDQASVDEPIWDIYRRDGDRWTLVIAMDTQREAEAWLAGWAAAHLKQVRKLMEQE